MNYVSSEKLVILGAGGAIGSNLVQSALSLGLTPNITMYDPYEPGVHGAAEEIYHCAFPEAQVCWTTDIREALQGAHYLISSGGAPRKEGMTREDLLKGNAEIAAQLGKDLKEARAPIKLAVVIFNPADITGLTVLVHSGLPPANVATLAALDSTRLQTALAQHFGLRQDKVTGCRTYGGHGEQMAVFASSTRVDGTALTELIGSPKLSCEQWAEVQTRVKQGGKRIIELRGRSSFQSPSHQSVLMVKAAMDGNGYGWPCGTYVDTPNQGFEKIMMAMETTVTTKGVTWKMPQGTGEELDALKASYEHLRNLRDEVIEMGVLPPLDTWKEVNPHLS